MNLHASLIETHLLDRLKETLSRHKMWRLILLNVAEGALRCENSPYVGKAGIRMRLSWERKQEMIGIVNNRMLYLLTCLSRG